MLRILTALFALGLTAGAANAVTYQLTFSHEITDFTEGFVPIAGVGVGTTYDTITTFTDNPRRSTKNPGFFGEKAEVIFDNGLGETLLLEPTSTLDSEGSIPMRITNNASFNNLDAISVYIAARNGTAGVINYLSGLRDPSGEAISGDSIADLIAFASAGDLSRFPADFSLGFILIGGNTSTIYGDCTASNFCSIEAKVTGISIAAVPLPASAVFLLAGLMGIGVAGRKRKAI